MSRSPLHVLVVVASAVALFACGSSESTSSTSTGTGGSTATTTTGATGTGGSASTATGTSSATGSTGTGSAITNACTNAADTKIRTDKDVKGISATCGTTNLGDPKPTYDCIKAGTGFSDDCTTCYADSVVCAAKNCIGKCLSDPMGQPCSDCRQMFCNAAFEACSGVPAT
jgi:hypothetical protein